MIFCNPNAGYAEFFQYQSDWLDYYYNNGINVFVWNYRGYGSSEGTPTPKVNKNVSTQINFRN
jgi:alpha-beta hydrolase superfamily lysophospholipase